MDQGRKFGLYDVPHEPTVYIGIVVTQDIAEGDNALVVADSGGNGAIDSGELLHTQAFSSGLSIARSKDS